MSDKSLILSKKSIEQKLERMVHEIHEKCYLEKELILCGIEGNGNIIADRIAKGLMEISKIKITVCSIKIDKSNPLSTPISCSLDRNFNRASIILIDDVSNSGKTIIYAASFFMNYLVNSIKTLVLVDRNHNKFPVNTDFVGLTMSTTLKEHIEVYLNTKNEGVYLV